MDCKDILIKCYGRNFVEDRAYSDTILTIEELVALCEELYYTVENLQEELEDLNQEIEDNYIPIKKSEQYGISDDDFI